jgi:hypothetical protein
MAKRRRLPDKVHRQIHERLQRPLQVMRLGRVGPEEHQDRFIAKGVVLHSAQLGCKQVVGSHGEGPEHNARALLRVSPARSEEMVS